MDRILYKGNVRVYLQGKNALMPITPEASIHRYISYYIGDSYTNLIICDHRPKTVAEARQILQTKHQNGFAKHFNQVAKAEIRFDKVTKCMTIDLRNPETPSPEYPVLWMGILEDNIMPSYEVQWEIFKSLNANQTAFVALIRPTS